MLFFKKELIRHLIIWKTLHFKALTWIWLSKVKGQLYPKKGVDIAFIFFQPQKLVCTIEYHPHNYIVEDLGHSWGTLLKNCLGAVFRQGFNKASNYLENLAFSRFEHRYGFLK